MIQIHGPNYLTPVPQGRIFRIEYKDGSRTCYPINVSLDLREVARTLDEMQDVMTLGFMQGYEIVCLDQQLCLVDENGVPAGNIEGERFDGWIAMSGRVSDISDILKHEVTHEWWYSLSYVDQYAFWQAVNVVPKPPDHPVWEERPGEISAEWITAALWGEPVDERMLQPTELQLRAIREWAQPRLARSSRALIAVDEPYIEVKVTRGDNFAYVNGVKTPLVEGYPDAVAETYNGFFSLPVAFLTKVLGGTKSWDQETQTGTFRFPR